MIQFVFIGKEIERKAQEGEDISILENGEPIKYSRHQTGKTRAVDARLILKPRRNSLRRLMRDSGLSQHAIERFLRGERTHPTTRARLAKTIEHLNQLETRVRIVND